MRQHHGFTLIELAIVLVIITILIGGLAVPLSAQIQARRIAETRADMQAIHDALIGYAMSHYITPPSCTCTYDASGDFSGGCSARLCPLTSTANASFSPIRHYLPCPDAPNDGNPLTTNDDDGLEDRDKTTGDCTLSRGALPWATLGVKGQDAWGNRYTYAVTRAFANDKVGFTSMPDAATPSASGTPGDLNVYPDSTCGTALVSDLPVIVVSHGANGRGAQNANGGTPLAPASVAADERQNLAVGSLPCASAQKFVSHNPTEDFDDLVTWLSRNELFNRVCPSGGCP